MCGGLGYRGMRVKIETDSALDVTTKSPNSLERSTPSTSFCPTGPVSAAAVILPHDFCHELLDDSKKLSHKRREIIYDEITNRDDIVWAMSLGNVNEIDEINILKSTHAAMARAAKKLKQAPDYCLIDGLPVSGFPIPSEGIVKGDGKSLSIAAASILAKTHRDTYMEKIHQEFPVYFWSKNKGYPTVEHRNSIREFGATIHHRKSFKLLPEQLKLEL